MSTPSTTTFSPDDLAAVYQGLPPGQTQPNATLAEHTWMKVGGTADILFTAKSVDDIVLAVSLAHRHHLPLFMLGGGSNIVVKDGGIRGLVVKNRADKIYLSGIKGTKSTGQSVANSVSLTAESGCIINQLVRYTIDEALSGLQDFLGVPGTVGGAVYNNSHHLDHLIGDYIQTVEVIDTTGQKKTYTHDELHFAYDESLIQHTKDIILSATFSLSSGDKKKLWQAAESALKRRRDSQPLEIPSSGCMFKNISRADAIIHQTPEGTVSSSKLIDLAGLKGTSIGGATISPKHANFIVNNGTATAKDVSTLADLVSSRVKERFGVPLDREVFFVGED